MKPTAEAKRLVKKFTIHTGANTVVSEYVAKQLAFICISEIRNGINNTAHGSAWELDVLVKKEDFWNKVEEAIKHI